MTIDDLKYRREILMEEIRKIDEQIYKMRTYNLMFQKEKYNGYDYKEEERRKREEQRKKAIDNIAFMFSNDTYDWSI